jgi:DNA-binding YbaB/EbfC family protein
VSDNDDLESITGATDAIGIGGLDLGALLQQAQAMQEQLVAAQEQQAGQVVTGTAGGGKVSIQMTGGGQFVGVSIAADVVDPDDIEMLEDLVLAALHHATSQVAELQQQSMGGLDLGGLGGLLGGS